MRHNWSNFIWWSGKHGMDSGQQEFVVVIICLDNFRFCVPLGRHSVRFD